VAQLFRAGGVLGEFGQIDSVLGGKPPRQRCDRRAAWQPRRTEIAFGRAHLEERIERALARMGLAGSARHLAGQYSGGMLRRLEIAQSLLHRPEVLILDEPTVGLDPGARDTVWNRILELRDRFQRTMIVTSHLMNEVDEFCDRIALIDLGRIVAIGTPAELKAKVGPGATLDDVFVHLVTPSEGEQEGNYGEVRRARRAIRDHG